MREIIKLFTPQIFLDLYREINKPHHDELFDGDDKLFKSILKETEYYVEYGCGASTNYVLNNTNANVLSIDTSLKWVKYVKEYNTPKNKRLKIKHINVGQVGDWGYPLNYNKRDNFLKYANYPWRGANSPDTILIDGRFRVLCFLTCLKHANKGTTIIFDDYINRMHYHIVEEFIPRTKSYGRQCIFIVPDKHKLCMDKINHEINKFQYVLS
jgi:hypothetical protein